jgi:hypothetical protein
MIDFTCVGYDIRKWPQNGYLTADATEWEVIDNLFDRAKNEVGTHENDFQLLDIRTNEDCDHLMDIISAVSGAALVCIELPSLVVDALQKDKGWDIKRNVSNNNWTRLGYDVCDVNGFFSILHMGKLSDNGIELFPNDQIMEAAFLAQAANILVPDHAPFVVTSIRIAINS